MARYASVLFKSLFATLIKMEIEGEATPAQVEAASPKVKMHLVSDDIYTRVVSEGFKDFNYVDDEWLRKDAGTD